MGMFSDKQRKQQQERTQQARTERDPFHMFRAMAAHPAPALGRYAETFPERMKGYEDEFVKPFTAKRHAIRTSGRYSPEGERHELARTVGETRRAVVQRKAERAKLYGDALAAERAKKMPTPAQENEVVKYWRQREIREHVAGLLATSKFQDGKGRPLAVLAALEQAIERNVGHDWLDAIESAPVPLVDRSILRDVRMQLIDSSDPELTDLAELARMHEQALNFIERGLLDAAAADGVSLNGPEAKGEDAPPAEPPPPAAPVYGSAGA